MRNTKAKKDIIKLLSKAPSPLSAPDLLLKLKNSVNKTTVYRILENLIIKGDVKELDFGEGKKRYEASTDHHHHLICRTCKKIEHIEVKEIEKSLNLVQQKLSAKKDFKITDHSLEFFGFCSTCQ